MLGIFKKKQPESLTTKSAYYERECVINTSTDIFLILSDARSFNFQPSKNTITVSNISLSGTTSKMITKEMGIPKYTFDNKANIEGHKILFYKEEADIYRFLLQFHFIDDQLFFVANKIYTGMSLPDSNKVKIVKQLAQKYLNISDYDVSDDFDIYISDTRGNQVFSRDGVYFFLNYLTGDSIKEELWNKYSFLEEELAKKKLDSFKESLDKML